MGTDVSMVWPTRNVRVLEKEQDDGPRLGLGQRIFSRPALRPAAAGEVEAGHGPPVFGIVPVEVQAADAVFVDPAVAVVVEALGLRRYNRPCRPSARIISRPVLSSGSMIIVPLPGSTFFRTWRMKPSPSRSSGGSSSSRPSRSSSYGRTVLRCDWAVFR